MNSFTYMRSEGDCVWQISFEQATLRDRRFIGPKAVHRVILIFQDLEASTQSARIRTGVNEMMTWFGQAAPMTLEPDEGAALRLLTPGPVPMGEIRVQGQILDVGRVQPKARRVALPGANAALGNLYSSDWPKAGEEIVLAATRISRAAEQVEITVPPLPLEVQFSTPIEGEADVRLDSRIRVQFSRDVAPASLEDRIRVTYSQADSVERGEPQRPALEITVRYNADNHSVEITPSKPLERFRGVTVELLEGISGTDGSVLRGWTLKFSTGGS